MSRTVRMPLIAWWRRMSDVAVSLVKNCAKNARHDTPNGERQIGHDAVMPVIRSVSDGFESESSSTLGLHRFHEPSSAVFHILLSSERGEDRVEGGKLQRVAKIRDGIVAHHLAFSEDHDARAHLLDDFEHVRTEHDEFSFVREASDEGLQEARSADV